MRTNPTTCETLTALQSQRIALMRRMQNLRPYPTDKEIFRRLVTELERVTKEIQTWQGRLR